MNVLYQRRTIVYGKIIETEKLREEITKSSELPEISNVMRLPSQSNRVGTEHVHLTCPSQDALGCFKSRVPLAQNKYHLVLVVLRISGYGLIAFNQVRTDKVYLVRDPQTCGYQEDPERERTEVQHNPRQMGHFHLRFSMKQQTCTCSPTHADQSGCNSCQWLTALP